MISHMMDTVSSLDCTITLRPHLIVSCCTARWQAVDSEACGSPSLAALATWGVSGAIFNYFPTMMISAWLEIRLAHAQI
jgi:hypothetical protein